MTKTTALELTPEQIVSYHAVGFLILRGERVMLNIHDWQALKNGPVAGQFLLLANDPPRHSLHESAKAEGQEDSCPAPLIAMLSG